MSIRVNKGLPHPNPSPKERGMDLTEKRSNIYVL